MESWRKVWREGLAPLLSTGGLEALRQALVTDDARLLPFDAVHGGHVEQGAAFERHALAVVPGRAAAHGERNAMAVAGSGDTDHVGLVAWCDDDVGHLVLQSGGEDRRIPVIVARLAPQIGRIDARWDIADVGEQCVNRVTRGGTDVWNGQGGVRHRR